MAMRSVFRKLRHNDRDGEFSSPDLSAASSPTRSPRGSTDRSRDERSHERSRSLGDHFNPHKIIAAATSHMRDSSESSRSRERVYFDSNGDPISRHQHRKEERKHSKERHRKENEARQQEIALRRRNSDALAEQLESPEMRARYGELPLNMSQDWRHEQRFDLAQMDTDKIGEVFTFRARVHAVRKISAHLVFIVLRQRNITIQGVLQEEEGVVSGHMVRWTERIAPEAIVIVTGLAQTPKQEVKLTSIHDVEIQINQLHVVSHRAEPLPFDVYEAEIARGEAEDDTEEEPQKGLPTIGMRVRLNNRIIDLRTTSSQAIFRIQSGVCNIFRSSLDVQNFTEIHTPKLQGAATESGASVFEVKYFGRSAFLAQSPQLAKQMCIAADFERVYEVGPVFRAEDSNTHRHLTEYTGLDIEMAIEEHYHECLMVIDNMFKNVFKGIYERYRKELDTVKKHFPHEDLVWLEETPILRFADGIKMLREAGYREEDGTEPNEFEDLHTRGEITLGQLVKQKYGTDYYILDKFPVGARPFYAMPDPTDDRVTNSFDIFVRGQEVLSGGQRIHDAKILEKKMKDLGMSLDGMEEYISGFRWAAPPHAGGGIGLERVVMLMLNLGDIRFASLWPRDPRSLPARPVRLELRHPEASTLNPPWEEHELEEGFRKELQPIEKLIANYGDATNTSWLEERFQIWRHQETGAAVGYVVSGTYCVCLGNPLCDKSQYTMIVSSFLQFVRRELHMKPIWLLVCSEIEEILAERWNWRTLTCVAEERADPTVDPAQNKDSELGRKIRQASHAGVRIIDCANPVPQDIRDQCEKRMQDWLKNRKGTQVHLTNLNPWVDMSHRRYFYAVDKDGTICSLCVLAQLSPEHGYQVKYSLDFPGAPSGTIEAISRHALKAAAEAGAKSVTFGGSATAHLHPVHNLSGVSVRALAKAYHSIASNFRLVAKGEFREKLGAREDPTYICYPPRGLGPRGIRAILSVFQDDEH